MSEEKKLTDRELLLIAYGAMRTSASESKYNTAFKEILTIIEYHLYPSPVFIVPASTETK